MAVEFLNRLSPTNLVVGKVLSRELSSSHTSGDSEKITQVADYIYLIDSINSVVETEIRTGNTQGSLRRILDPEHIKSAMEDIYRARRDSNRITEVRRELGQSYDYYTNLLDRAAIRWDTTLPQTRTSESDVQYVLSSIPNLTNEQKVTVFQLCGYSPQMSRDFVYDDSHSRLATAVVETGKEVISIAAGAAVTAKIKEEYPDFNIPNWMSTPLAHLIFQPTQWMLNSANVALMEQDGHSLNSVSDYAYRLFSKSDIGFRRKVAKVAGYGTELIKEGFWTTMGLFHIEADTPAGTFDSTVFNVVGSTIAAGQNLIQVGLTKLYLKLKSFRGKPYWDSKSQS